MRKKRIWLLNVMLVVAGFVVFAQGSIDTFADDATSQIDSTNVVGTGSGIQILNKPVLEQRPESEIKVIGGVYTPFKSGYVAGTLGDLMHRGDNIEVTGTGYIRIRTELEFWYGVGKASMPEITALTKDTKVKPVGEGNQYFTESSFNQSDDTPEIGYNDRFIWFSGTIKIGQLEKINGYQAQFNIGVSNVSFNQVSSGTSIVYDTDNGILPSYSYKLISRGINDGDYLDDQLLEARDRQFNGTDQNTVYKDEDEDTANQWWTFIYAGDQDGKHYYRLLNDLTGKYLSVANNDAGSHVITENRDDNSQKQLWAINKVDGDTNTALANHVSNAIYDTFQNKASQLYLTDDGTGISQQSLGDAGTALFEPRYTRGYTDHNADGFPDSLLPALRLDKTKYTRYEAESLDTSKYAAQGTDAERNWRGNSDASGTRFVRLNKANPSLTQTVDVPQTGPYDVLIHYGTSADVNTPVYVTTKLSDGKQYYLDKDGKTSVVTSDNLDSKLAQQVIDFTNNSTYPASAHNSKSHKFLLWFSDGSIEQTQLYLHAGKNDITFENSTDAPLDLDYLDVALKSTNPVTESSSSASSTVTGSGVPITGNDNSSSDASTSSNSAIMASSDSSGDSSSNNGAASTLVSSTSKSVTPKAFIGYNKRVIYSYKETIFSKKNRMTKLPKNTTFKVVGVKKAASGLLRYRLSNGSYITANAKFVGKLYYTKLDKKIRVINKKGLYEYRSNAFHKGQRVKHVKVKSILTVKKMIKGSLVNRFQLMNGNYVTANKLYVKRSD